MKNPIAGTLLPVTDCFAYFVLNDQNRDKRRSQKTTNIWCGTLFSSKAGNELT